MAEILVFQVAADLAVGAGVGWALFRFGRWTRGWSVAAAAAVALVVWFSTGGIVLPRSFAIAARMALALALGVFFAVAMRRQGRRMRAAILAGFIAFAVAGVLTYPVESHVVKLDMPRP